MYLKNVILFCCATFVFVACEDDKSTNETTVDDNNYVGKEVGNFSSAEWYPGGELGTTEDIGAASYESETPAVQNQGLFNVFKYGESFFERNFNASQAPFNGLGPAYVRQACITCHPGYGHGKRQTEYNASQYGNGYLLVIYDKDTKNYISQVTGMPQTRASHPFLPPIDESGITIKWLNTTDEHNNTFPDGETYSLIYPEVTIAQSAFNTNPKPTNYDVRLESTIGVYGTGLIDAIPDDSILVQYRTAASHGATLNSTLFDGTNFTASMYYTLADGTKKIKRYTYALTRASLQDGPGANAIWNITNVSRSDRNKLYTTSAWAKAMSENQSVIDAIKQDQTSPYYASTDEEIRKRIVTLLDPSTNQFDNSYHNFSAEMNDENYYEFLVWHRGLAVPRARNLNDEKVQKGKELFYEIGCTRCHRPSWKTGTDDYWASENVKKQGQLPKYPNQTIWPYSDFVQHRLYMVNDIKGDWCRTTPLWGRGLSLINTGAEDRLHDCRARNEVEAIMWHGYNSQSDAYGPAQKFYKLSKDERDAIVKFLRSI